MTSAVVAARQCGTAAQLCLISQPQCIGEFEAFAKPALYPAIGSGSGEQWLTSPGYWREQA